MEANMKKRVNRKVVIILATILLFVVAVLGLLCWYSSNTMNRETLASGATRATEDKEYIESDDGIDEQLLQILEQDYDIDNEEKETETASELSTNLVSEITVPETVELTNQSIMVQDITISPDENAIFQCYEKDAEKYQWEFYSILDKKWEAADIKQDFMIYEETDSLGRQVSCLSVPGNEEYEQLSVRCSAVFSERENIISEGCLYLFHGAIEKISILPMEAEAGEYISNLCQEVLVVERDGTETQLYGLQSLAFCVNQDEEESSVYDEASSVTTETYTKTFQEVPYYLVENGEQSVAVKLRMNGEVYDTEVTITGKDTTAPKLENVRADYEVSNQDIESSNVRIYASATDNYDIPSELCFAFGKEAECKEDDFLWSPKLPLSIEVKDNGTYYFFVKDTAGNVSYEEVEIITVDMKEPVIEDIIFHNADGKEARIEVIASDKTELEYCFHLSDNTSEQWQKDSVYPVDANGEYVVEVRDAAGNCSKGTITISEIDNQAPVITRIDIKSDYSSEQVPILIEENMK